MLGNRKGVTSDTGRPCWSLEGSEAVSEGQDVTQSSWPLSRGWEEAFAEPSTALHHNREAQQERGRAGPREEKTPHHGRQRTSLSDNKGSWQVTAVVSERRPATCPDGLLFCSQSSRCPDVIRPEVLRVFLGQCLCLLLGAGPRGLAPACSLLCPFVWR